MAGILDLNVRRLNKKNKQEVAALKLENHLLSLEQKALQLQMNPHFIFNILNYKDLDFFGHWTILMLQTKKKSNFIFKY